MNLTDAIRKMLAETKTSIRGLAREIGYASAGSLMNQLGRGNMNVATLYRICNALGYEITVQPKSRRGVRPQGQIIIEMDAQPIKKEDDGE